MALRSDRSPSSSDFPRPSLVQRKNEDKDDGSVFAEAKGKKLQFAPGELVRPLSFIEIFCACGGIYNSMSTVQAIWLESKTPLEPRKVMEALSILSRQVSVLQLCLCKRGLKLWFRRMKNFSIDFETSWENNPLEVYESLLSKPYDMWNGPLWCARLVLSKETNSTGGFNGVLIFGAQHCITDGTTNMKLCRETVEILNQMESGREVIPSFSPLSPIIENSHESQHPVGFLSKYVVKKVTAVLVKSFNKKTSFGGAFPLPETKMFNTKVLFTSLSTDETQRLMKQCKAERITVHSCITATINFALLKTAHFWSYSEMGKTSISVTHCVNMRRFFEENQRDVPGCHISFIEQKTKSSLNDANDFWLHARDLHANLKERLENDDMAGKILPIIPLMSLVFPINNYLTAKGLKNKTDCHYVTTNMGNLKDLLPEPKEGDHIEIVNLLRSVYCPFSGNPFLVTFHTFRNRLMLSMDYFTNKVSDDVARDFFRVFITYIKALANTGSIMEEHNVAFSK